MYDANKEWVILKEENRAFLPSETHDLNDEEVRRAQERESLEEYQLSFDPQNGKFLHYQGLFSPITQSQATAVCFPRLMLPSAYRMDVTHDVHEQKGYAWLAKFMHTIQEHHVWTKM